jgi:membrane protease YdiL (CAAX protease family)
VGVDTDQEQAIGYENAVSFFQLSLVFISLAVFPPVAEELLFRGFLFGGLRKKMTFVGAAVVTSIFFGALHLFTGMPGEGLIWIAAIDTFVLSMVLCYVREKTGAIWACIGIHAVKNSLAFLLYFVIK